MSALKPEQLDSLNKQMDTQFKKAFFDLLEEKVREEPPDYDWITRLYEEIRNRLASLLREGSQTRKEIEDSMDVVLFRQMIENKAFGAVELYNLIEHVFELCKKLGSPARDNEVDKFKFQVLGLMKNNGTFAQIVPLFIKNANECIDNIYKDLQVVKDNLEKAKKK
tara:strand:+ start:2468 stop:2965 length:498 start_codon:yes stop_codon:yes gene_type:complete